MSLSAQLLKRAKRQEKSSFYKLFQEIVTCSHMLSEISPRKRRPWLSSVLRELYDKQKGICAICSSPLNFGSHEVDHIIPFCYGGGNERANLQLTCRKCNRLKRHSVKPRDLLKYLEDRYMNR